jgi:hypothetical protein
MIWAALIAATVAQVVLFAFAFATPAYRERRRRRLNALPGRIDFDEARSRVRRGEGVFLDNQRLGIDGRLWFLPGLAAGERAGLRGLYRGQAVQVAAATAADVEALTQDARAKVIVLKEPSHLDSD